MPSHRFTTDVKGLPGHLERLVDGKYPPGDMSWNDNHVELSVSWGRDSGSVLINPVISSRMLLEEINWFLRELGCDEIPTLRWQERFTDVTASSTKHHLFAAWFNSRRKVNDLIRTLQRARDHSMGRDA